MCKFENRKSRKYDIVVKAIQDYVKEICKNLKAI